MMNGTKKARNTGKNIDTNTYDPADPLTSETQMWQKERSVKADMTCQH